MCERLSATYLVLIIHRPPSVVRKTIRWVVIWNNASTAKFTRLSRLILLLYCVQAVQSVCDWNHDVQEGRKRKKEDNAAYDLKSSSVRWDDKKKVEVEDQDLMLLKDEEYVCIVFPVAPLA